MLSLILGLDKKLKGAPDNVLTMMIIALIVLGLLIAVFGTPTMKAALILYWMLP